MTVIGGYLGAGKTTLLNHVLRSGDARIAVLVNDFGSVNIDESLIVASDEQMITLDNGCICCSLADGLAVALDQVRGLSPRPERLVIEASGVGDPSSIAANAQGRGLSLEATVTVVDAESFVSKSRDRYVGDVVVQQVRHADLLVLNKTDLVDTAQLAAVRSLLGSLVPTAPIVNAVLGALPLELMFGLERPDASPPAQAAAPTASRHHVNDVFVSWSATVDVEFDRTSLQEALGALPAWVVRVKGVVCSATQRRLIVHRVGSRVSVEDGGQWSTGPSNLVAIGLRSEATTHNPLDALIERCNQH